MTLDLRALAGQVPPDILQDHLLKRGFRLENPGPEGVVVYSRDGVVLDVPARMDFGDYGRRVEELIGLLAAVDDVRPTDLLDTLLLAGRMKRATPTTDLRDTLMTWADRRIDEILAAPRMWGSDEAVEMQVLQLLEMRSLALRPARAVENPREVLDRYAAFLRERFPSLPPAPLHRLVPTEVVGVLREFCAVLAAASVERSEESCAEVVLYASRAPAKEPGGGSPSQ